uniref:Enolase-phosphatase E1 n=1 Tax=Triticum urartu TaxID=4572 RepID=A0A8R7PNX9_TRIUA
MLLPLVASSSASTASAGFFSGSGRSFLRDASIVPHHHTHHTSSSGCRSLIQGVSKVGLRYGSNPLLLRSSLAPPPSHHCFRRAPAGGRTVVVAAAAAAAAADSNYCLTAKDIRCVVVDIEGTTTPISFVADVLFPYARANARAHLAATYHTQQTREDVALLRAQIDEDLAEGVTGAVALPPPDDIDQDKTIDGLVANVQAMIDADRKLTALKQLQGRVWRRGFESGEIKGEVYDDVVQALAEWDANGIKSYIYSSGSREAQRLIFGNTAAHGDLRRYLSAFFDTNVGGKKESRSYYEIWQTLGVDSPSQILFLTDVYQEATAARDAGLEVLISIRPGNAPLPEDHGFQTITSFAQIAT